MAAKLSDQVIERQNFIQRIHDSHRNLIDLSVNAKTKERLGDVLHNPRLTGNRHIGDPNHPANDLMNRPPSNYDILLQAGDPDLYRDSPRSDIAGMKTKSGKLIRVGSSKKGYHADFKEHVLPMINRNFSKQELRDMNLYVEYGGAPGRAGWAGQCSYRIGRGGKKYAVVTVRNKYRHHEEVITHELVHARRNMMGERIRDRDREEAETELETVARVSPENFDRIECGYYHRIDKKNPASWHRFRTEDRILVTGSKAKALRGKAAQKAVKEKYPLSHIARIGGGRSPVVKSTSASGCIPPSLEWVDRYFTIRLPGGGKVEHHIRFQKKATLAEVRTLLRDQFGPGIRVVEWHDGKSKLVIAPKKKGVR